MPPERLDTDTLYRACRTLAAGDPALRSLFDRNGVPPLWRRNPGFPTLVKLILEQQVSLASGAAAFRRLEERLGGTVTPSGFVTLADDELRAVGFSRQKTRYVRLLADSLITGDIDLERVSSLDDGSVIAELTSLVGIGPWTAANYLLFALGRPDAWPTGDRALVVSLGRALGLPDAPGYEEADAMAEQWRPWRAVAARLLWHDYLGGPGAEPTGF